VESVRKLKRTSTFIVDRGEAKPARSLTKILGGILASTNSIKKPSTLHGKFEECKGLASLDLCCAADWGTLIVDYDGIEDPNISDFNDRISDYYLKRTIKKFNSTTDNSLITFFFQLTRYLQQSIGTVAAIDLNAYSKSVGFDLDTTL